MFDQLRKVGGRGNNNTNGVLFAVFDGDVEDFRDVVGDNRSHVIGSDGFDDFFNFGRSVGGWAANKSGGNSNGDGIAIRALAFEGGFRHFGTCDVENRKSTSDEQTVHTTTDAFSEDKSLVTGDGNRGIGAHANIGSACSRTRSFESCRSNARGTSGT